MPTKQEQLNAILTKTAERYDEVENDKLFAYAVREMRRVELELFDLLMGYAGSDNKVKKERIISLLADLQVIQQKLYADGLKAMTDVVTASAEAGIGGSSIALATAVGAFAEIGEQHFNRISAEAVRYVVSRFGDDGLVLSDRVWDYSNDVRAEMETVLRSGIIRGESVNTLIAKVRRVHSNQTWKIKRLVVTEGNVAYRTGSAYVAQQSQYVKGLRIHRGEADRPDHRCSELEKIDRYGMGKGIYIPTDPEVLNPHPNCTSYVTYVLFEGGNNVVNER